MCLQQDTLLTLSPVWIEELPLSLHVNVQDVNGGVVQPFAVQLTLPGTSRQQMRSRVETCIHMCYIDTSRNNHTANEAKGGDVHTHVLRRHFSEMRPRVKTYTHMY